MRRPTERPPSTACYRRPRRRATTALGGTQSFEETLRQKCAPRVIAIGDLNGAHDLLRRMLRGLDVIDRHGKFVAPNTHVIQVGDLFNRGPDARGALLYLDELREQAPALGSRVTVLLGNHEVMTALGNEMYCTAGEYLSFATKKQRDAWRTRVKKAKRRLARDHPAGGPVLPLGPRLEAWKIANVPGRSAMRRALKPRGHVGRILRRLPVAVIDAGCVFCHAGLTPAWAKLGIDGLNEAAADAWSEAPSFFRHMDRSTVLNDPDGPLWNRRLSMKPTKKVRKELEVSLRRLGVDRMVVGHTQTQNVAGGTHGRIATLHDTQLVCIDVGLGRATHTAALVIQRGRGKEWTPDGARTLWR